MRCDNVYLHNPVVRLAWNFGIVHYYTPLPAGSWVSNVAGTADRDMYTLRFLPGCIRAASSAVSVEYCNSSPSVVKMGDFDFAIELLIFLVDARPVLWDKKDDIYKDTIETKKAWREIYVCLQEDFEALGGVKKRLYRVLP